MSIIPLYLRPNYRSIAEKLGYDQAQQALLTEFAERGYATIDIADDGFDALADEIVRGLEPGYGPDGRSQDAWRTHPAVRTLAVNQQLLDTLKLLYGRDAFPFQTLNFNKGTEQETHSDIIHFDSAPSGFMAGIWVALEDIDAGNGPLHYYPASHKLPRLTLADADVPGSAALADAYSRFYEPMIARVVRDNELQREEGHIRRGQAIIWSANLLHGGSPIRQPGRSRHSQVIHYYFDDCAWFTPLFSDPLIGLTLHREPTDIRTGATRRGRYAGGAAPMARPALPARAMNWLKRRAVRRQAEESLSRTDAAAGS